MTRDPQRFRAGDDGGERPARFYFAVDLPEHAAAEHALGSLRSSSVLRSPVTFMPGDIVELDALAATVVGEPLDSDGGQSSGESGEQADTGTTRLSELTHAFACSVFFEYNAI